MSDTENVEEKKPIVIRNSTDLQRLKLEKLMKNPDKPIIIPEKPKEKGMPAVPDFVRNVMGSSAGAGSGEFHVYRHLRRKEYARQKYMKEKGEREKLEQDYHDKLEENKKLAEQKTAKKRAKRQKKKQHLKNKRKKPNCNKSKLESSDSEEEESEEENIDETDTKSDETSNEKSIDIRACAEANKENNEHDKLDNSNDGKSGENSNDTTKKNEDCNAINKDIVQEFGNILQVELEKHSDDSAKEDTNTDIKQ